MDLRAQRSAALGELLSRMGLDPAAPVRLLGVPKSAWPPPGSPRRSSAVELALRRRPRSSSRPRRSTRPTRRVHRARRAGPGSPSSSSATTSRRSTSSASGGRSGRHRAAALRHAPPGRSPRRTRARKAEQRSLGAAVELVTREVRTRLAEAEAARALVTELRRRMTPVAERAGVEAQRAIEGRNVDVGRALEVDERRVRLELRLLRFVRRYWTAVGELRHAVGGRLPAEAGDHRRKTESRRDAQIVGRERCAPFMRPRSSRSSRRARVAVCPSTRAATWSSIGRRCTRLRSPSTRPTWAAPHGPRRARPVHHRLRRRRRQRRWHPAEGQLGRGFVREAELQRQARRVR